MKSGKNMLQKSFLKLVVCVLLFAASNAWAGYPVLDTGDPDERVCNPKSYTDNGDGTINDDVTGLQWLELLPSSNQRTWQTAATYCNSLIFPAGAGGYTDWRLPTVQELTTLVDLGLANPAIDETIFYMPSQLKYWTADPPLPAPAYPFYIDFNTGDVGRDQQSSVRLSVRPVRGDYYGPQYAFGINGDGTVSDIDTGLMWQQCSHGQTSSGSGCSGTAVSRTWSQAFAYIESLNDAAYLGYEDWRLPTSNELQSLFDYGRSNPSTVFPNTSSVGYWSSTIQSNNAGYAWYAHFQYGEVYSTSKNSGYYVRAVRGGECYAECIENSHCDDGVACNGEETCRNLNCVPGLTTCEENEYCDEEDDACVECLTDEHCSDGVFCNGAETCLDGVCFDAAMPCSGDTSVCDEDGDRCVQCLENADCNDGVACNGEETCQSEICVAGTTTCAAGEYCNESSDECVECLNNTHCDNGVFCDGAETCVANACVDGTFPCTGDDVCDEDIDACVECYDDTHCPDDSLYCTLDPLCDNYACGFEETCPGEQCNETSEQCVACLTDDHCDNGVFCDGAEVCTGDACFDGTEPCEGNVDFPFCDESMDDCVECLVDEDCASGYACFSGTCAPGGFMQIDKASVKAGKTVGTDSMKLSGLLDAGESDLLAADEVIVSLTAEYIPDPGVIEYSFPVAAEFLKKGKYTSPKIKSADKTDPVTSLAIDTNKGTMKFSAQKVDLTGLSCPIICRVTIGDDVYIAEMAMNEELVNGEKKPCPLPLLMGVYDSLDVEKVKAKKSTKTESDSISISGTFTIEGEFDQNEPVVIAIGSDDFTVEGAAFVEKKGSYSCKNYDSGIGLVTAKFDTVKAEYSIKIKNATLSDSGNVDFDLALFGNLLSSSNQIELPPDP